MARLISVVLPAPLRPSRPTTSPFCIEKVTPSSTRFVFANERATSRNSSIAVMRVASSSDVRADRP
jgi:hypothetical protein